jgi:hypothetical protein
MTHIRVDMPKEKEEKEKEKKNTTLKCEAGMSTIT